MALGAHKLRFELRELLLVALGAMPGALLRWQAGVQPVPWLGGSAGADLLVNVVGSFVLGFLAGPIPRRTGLVLLVGIGFCGSLTTFSSWVLDVVKLLEAGRPLGAGGLVLGSLAAGLAAAGLGLLVWRWSRELFGAEGGFISLGLYCLSPTMVANASLATVDLFTALWFLVAVRAWWGLLSKVTLGSVLLAGISAGLLAATKISAVLLVPVVMVMAAWRLWAAGFPPVALPAFAAGRRLPGPGALAVALAAAVVVAAATITKLPEKHLMAPTSRDPTLRGRTALPTCLVATTRPAATVATTAAEEAKAAPGRKPAQ